MSSIDQQFREQRQQIARQAQQQRESIERQGREHRERVAQAAAEARERLRQQRSELEEQVQEAKGGIRTEERLEERKRDLPITKPVDVKAKERLAGVEKQEKEIKGEIADVEKEVREAEQKDIEAIVKAETEAKTAAKQAEAQAIAEIAQAEAEFKKENVRLATGEYVNRAEFGNLPNVTQQKLTELGVEGYNRWLGEQQTLLSKYEAEGGYDLAGYLRDNPQANTGNLIAVGFTQDDIDSAVTQNKELAGWESDLKKSNPALYRVYQEGGIEGYNKEVLRLQNIASQYAVRSKWVSPATYRKIQDLKRQYEAGQLSKKDYEASVIALQPVQGFDLPAALDDKVPTATLLSLGITQEQINQVKEAQGVLGQLKPYKTEATPYYFGKDITTKEGVTLSMAPSYDLPKFLRDNPQFDTKKLVSVVGFSQEAVDAAVEYNQQPFVQETLGDQLITAIKAAGGDNFLTSKKYSWQSLLSLQEGKTFYPEWAEFLAKNPNIEQIIYNLGHPKWGRELQEPTISMEAFREAYKDVRADTYSKDELSLLGALANKEYKRLYGGGAAFTSGGIQALSFLFSPARALYPEVELKDISGLEWAVGVAQVALLAIPVVSIMGGTVARAGGAVATRGIVTGLEVGAGTTFAVAMGIQWADMSWAERGISLAITAAIFSPVGVRGLRRVLGARRVSSITNAETSLSRAWKNLDRIEVKYGRDAPQYTRALRRVESAQANLSKAVGGVAQSAGKSVRTAINLARDAGRAARNMDRALKKLKTTSTGSRNYASVASKAQRATEASRQADQRLINQFNKVKSLSASDLAAIEKRSGITGIKKAVLDVNKAQANLERAWVEVGKYEVGSSKYIKSLEAVSKAQSQLDEVLANFGAKLRVRAKISPAAGWDDIIAKLEGEIKQLRVEINSLERAARRAIFEREITSMNRQLGELRQSLASEEMQLIEYTKFRDSGIPAPSVSKYLIRWETKPPTRDELRRIFDQFSRKPVEPVKPKPGVAKPKVQVAVAEKPVVVERQLKLIPEVEKIPTKVEPRVEAPRVKGKGYEVSVEYEPSYRERMFEKPDVREETYIEAIGEPLPDTIVVVSGQTVDVPATERAIKTTIADIVKDAVKAATRAKIAGQTQAQIKAMVLNEVSTRVNAITEPLVMAQVKPLTKVLTKLATKTVPKTTVKVAVRIRPRIPRFPIFVTLPDGSTHTLTPEEIAGGAGWKQGFMYKFIFPPYGDNNIVNSRKPIAGIPYYAGAKSAYRSIIRRGGKLPPTIARDMGIFDVFVESSRYGKPRLIFKPDVKQKTRVTGVHKRRKTKSRAAPEVGLVSMR